MPNHARKLQWDSDLRITMKMDQELAAFFLNQPWPAWHAICKVLRDKRNQNAGTRMPPGEAE
jgi:hypothetical protein